MDKSPKTKIRINPSHPLDSLLKQRSKAQAQTPKPPKTDKIIKNAYGKFRNPQKGGVVNFDISTG